MTTQINKIDWVMRGIRFWLNSLEEKLGELENLGLIDPFDPDEQFLRQLGEIEEAIEAAGAECDRVFEEIAPEEQA